MLWLLAVFTGGAASFSSVRFRFSSATDGSGCSISLAHATLDAEASLVDGLMTRKGDRPVWFEAVLTQRFVSSAIESKHMRLRKDICRLTDMSSVVLVLVLEKL